jgi:hypothetical protein
LDANSGVQDCREPIGHQVEEKKKDAVDEDNSRNQKNVAIHNSTDKELSDPGDGENLLNDQASGQNARSQRTRICNEWKHRRAKCVNEDKSLFSNALGAGCSDEVGPCGFD